MKKMRTALIGCGMISHIYLENLKKADIVELVGCSDLRPERAASRAEEFGIRAMTNEEIFADPTIEFIVNTTYPTAHATVIRQALLAGKHVYTEKLFTETLEEANELMALAAARGLFMGGAPDTYLAGGCMLARQIIDGGIIGTPVMAEVSLSRSYHHERFYTGDEKRFAFAPHGGILFDMGSYYLTQLVFLLGSVQKVCGFSQIRNPDRTYQNPKSPLYGQPMTVESTNTAVGILQFAGGALGHVSITSESAAFTNRFCIHGTEGIIDLGDPNLYNGSVKVRNKAGMESEIYTSFGYTGKDFRALGAVDAMYAIRNNRAPRCSGELCRHVLEIANSIAESGNGNTVYEMTTAVERPAPFAPGYTENLELVLAL